MCQRKTKDRADGMREKSAHCPRRDSTCISGIRAHSASDCTTRIRPPRVSRNKHFRHSPCMCHNEKKMPDEWQARQAMLAILQVSSSKHNANKNTTRGRGPFHQSITVILTGEKREAVTNPTHVAVYLFLDLDQDRSRL